MARIRLVWHSPAGRAFRDTVRDTIKAYRFLVPEMTEVHVYLSPDVMGLGVPSHTRACFVSSEHRWELMISVDEENPSTEGLESYLLRALLTEAFEPAVRQFSEQVADVIDQVPLNGYPLPESGQDGLHKVLVELVRDCTTLLVPIMAREVEMMMGDRDFVPFWEREPAPPGTMITAMMEYGFHPAEDGPPEYREGLQRMGREQ